MLVDSHCHLNFKGLYEDIGAVIARARAAGVGKMLCINTRLSDYHQVRDIAAGFDDVYCSVGVHPHEAENEPDVAAAALIERCADPRTIGLGETGLDYFYEHAPKAAQIANFRAHIRAARATGLPVIIHSRDADYDCAALLRQEMGEGAFCGVIHCFTASRRFAEAVLELGFYISLSGIITFKNAEDLRDTAKIIPEDRLLVETDAPYLAPVPMRGKLCEPAFVAHTARFVADLRGVDYTDLTQTTGANFFRLFAKAKP